MSFNSGTGVATGTIQSIDVNFGNEVITMEDLNFSLPDLLDLSRTAFDNQDDLAFTEYLLGRDLVLNLSDNDDFAPAGDISGNIRNLDFNPTGDDVIRGNGGNDDLFTGDGTDKLYGGKGHDRLDGGKGADLVVGGKGRDEVSGSGGADQVYGNGGRDGLSGGKGSDSLYGGGSKDILNGDKGKDALFGGNDHDELFGGGGADKLNGGRGNDILQGGGGADDFIFADGAGNDVIVDFDTDKNREDIVLTDVSEITSYRDLMDNHIEQVGADVVIDDGAGLTITLLNINMDDLSAKDFLF